MRATQLQREGLELRPRAVRIRADDREHGVGAHGQHARRGFQEHVVRLVVTELGHDTDERRGAMRRPGVRAANRAAVDPGWKRSGS